LADTAITSGAGHVDHFDELVLSAMEFLERSVEELKERRPKFATIHLCQAIELLLKARLLKEHWSLIAAEPKIASLKKFESGELMTLSLSDALTRIAAVCNEAWDDQELESFRGIQKRRNQVTHFHDSAAFGSPALIVNASIRRGGRLPPDHSIPELAAITADFCNAWCALERLLTGRWRSHFWMFTRYVQLAETGMLALKPYLDARFKQLAGQVSHIRTSGGLIVPCLKCKREARQSREVFPGLTHQECLVCRDSEKTYEMQCPNSKCHAQVEVTRSLGAWCGSCGFSGGIDELAPWGDDVIPDTGTPARVAFCAECEFRVTDGSVLRTANGDLLCLHCFTQHAKIKKCEICRSRYCGESTWPEGCSVCEGGTALG